MKQVAIAAMLIGVALTACGGDDGDLAAFCEKATDAGQLDAVFDTFDPSDVEGTAAQFGDALTAYEALRGDAPKAVRDDLDVLIEFTTDFRNQLLAGDPTDPATTTEVGLDLEERFAEVEIATTELETFVTGGCVAR